MKKRIENERGQPYKPLFALRSACRIGDVNKYLFGGQRSIPELPVMGKSDVLENGAYA